MTCSPSARSTSAGPATITCAVSRVITAKCEATSRAAGSPATAPSAADATGTAAIASAIDAKRCGPPVAAPSPALRFGLLPSAAVDAAARALQQAHERHAQPQAEILREHALAQAGRGGRPAALREVLAAHDARPAVDPAGAEHVVRGRERAQRAVLAELARAGDRSLLAEAARVEQRVDPLADREPPLRVLRRDRLAAAVLLRELAPRADLLDFGAPVFRAHARRVA